jgi:hypothetical protein
MARGEGLTSTLPILGQILHLEKEQATKQALDHETKNFHAGKGMI